MQKALRYSFLLITTYLVVAYATGSGTVIKNGADGAAGVIKAFQGRS